MNAPCSKLLFRKAYPVTRLLLCALAILEPQFLRATTLSGLSEFSALSSGSFDRNAVWNTKGGDTQGNLWVVDGSDPNGSLVNGPADSQAAIAISLTPGVHTYSLLAGSPGASLPYFALNLFFNGNNVNPGISVFAQLQTNSTAPYPSFGPDGNSNTLTLAAAY